MKTLDIKCSAPHKVYIGRGIAERICDYIPQGSKVMLITDDTVYSLYGENTLCSLRSGGFNCFLYRSRAGECFKSFENYSHIIGSLVENKFTSQDIIIALGGGTVGDIAGICAATYHRGIGFLSIPTTLLAQVDSCIGGKNGINASNIKNAIGTFYHPLSVLCDTAFLKTLSLEDLKSGCGEILKYALISGDFNLARLTEDIKSNPDNIIEHCLKIKAEYVERDELDRGCRHILNLGHTVGHAIESRSDFAIPHGIAVANGLLYEARLFERLGYCSKEVAAMINSMLHSLGIPVHNIGFDGLFEPMTGDKKATGEYIEMPVIKAIGCCKMVKIPLAELKEAVYE